MAAHNDGPNIHEVMDDRLTNAIEKAMAHSEMPNYNKMIYTLVDNVKRELMEILGQIKSNDTNINLNEITTIDPEKIRTITKYIPNELSNIIDIKFCNKNYELILNKSDIIYYVKFKIKLPQSLQKSKNRNETTKINNYTTLLTNIIVYLYLKQNIIFNNGNDHITNIIPFGIYSSYIETKQVQVGDNNVGFSYIPRDETQNNLYNYGLPTNELVKNNKTIQQSFCINSFSKFINTNIFYNIELDINMARLFVKDNIDRDGGVYIIIPTNEIILQENWKSKLNQLNLDGDDTQSKIEKLKSDGSLDDIYNIIGEVLFTNIKDINKKRQYSKIVSHICSQQLFVVYLKLLLCGIYELYFPSPLNYVADDNKRPYILYNYSENIIVIKRSYIINYYTGNGMQKNGTNDMIIIYNFVTDRLFITMDIQNDHYKIDFTNKLALLAQPKVFFLNTQPHSGSVHLTTHGSRHSGTKKKQMTRRNSTGQFPSNRVRLSSIRMLNPQTSI
jgi:hypothetical protein